MWVIPQGRPFISNLLTAAHSVPALNSSVPLNNHCFKDLELWCLFLQQWNGTSFHEDCISSAEDLLLFTDAAPSIRFGGYFNGPWFASSWPPELSNQSLGEASSAAYEIYPVVIAALPWGRAWSGKNLIYCDNEAIVFTIIKSRSALLLSAPSYAVSPGLLHVLTFCSKLPTYPAVKITASLSRFSFQKFKRLTPEADADPTPVPPFSEAVFL